MFTSFGIKRLVAAILLPILELLKSIPGTGELIMAVEAIAALFGVTGLAHAAKARTISRKKLLSTAALLAILLEIAQLVPALHPYIPLLQKIAALFGAVAAGSAINKK